MFVNVGTGNLGASWRAAAIIASALSLGACDLEPCGSLDLSGVTLTYVGGTAVIAVGDQNRVDITRSCATPDCQRTQQIELKHGPAEQLMLTGSGRWLVYRSGDTTYEIDLDACQPSPSQGPMGCDEIDFGTEAIDELIGSLRGGDWIVYRTWGETKDTKVTNSQLWAIYVGDDPLFEAATPAFRLGTGLDLRVAAMGHRHLVARHSNGDGSEDLYLVDIAPPCAEFDSEGCNETRGRARLLASGQTFERVIITAGPTPSKLGRAPEFQHHVPTDATVIATSGQGADARTLIYEVESLSQVANFAGEVVTKHTALEDVPGLSPVSPDGSHLAYIAPNGTLALRDLDTQRSCMVRSSVGATHLLAGFASDGTIYLESEENRPNATYELVHVYNPLTQVVTPLVEPELVGKNFVWRLRAVPPRADYDEEPWAIVGSSHDYLARPNTTPDSLSYDDSRSEASFLPRGEEGLWVIEAEPDDHDADSYLNIHRFDPDVDDHLQRLSEPHRYASQEVCMSMLQSAGTTPWASQCSSPTQPEKFLDTGVPEGELGP